MSRTIFHVDMDSFFASCEQQANPKLRGVPIVVSGDPTSRTVVAAASREAKQWGVRSGMAIHEARALCPHVVFVPGNPDQYAAISRRMIAVLERYTYEVEVASIDEAFMDVTGWVGRFACAAHEGGEGGEHGWACGAVRLAEQVAHDLAREVGEYVTCSIGIAQNKRLAKIASDFRKPKSVTFVYPDAAGPPSVHPLRISPAPPGVILLSRSDLLAALTLRDLHGIGARVEARLHALGIRTIASLAATPLDVLVTEFGVYGYELHDMAMGHDARDVQPEDADPKSVGHSVTLPRDLRTLPEVRPVVEELAEKVAARARRYGFRGATVHVVVRFKDFTSTSEQRALHHVTDDGLEIAREAIAMLRSFLHRSASTGGGTEPEHFTRPIRLVGIALGTLQRRDPAQRSLFPKDHKWERATRALDEANNRHGDWTVQRAALLPPARAPRQRFDGSAGAVVSKVTGVRAQRFLRQAAAAFQATRHLRNGK